MFTSYSIFIFTIFMLFAVYLEIRGWKVSKNCAKNLKNIMHEWNNNHQLTQQEKQYLANMVKISFSPFSVVKLILFIWLLPFKDIKISKNAVSLKQKDSELYTKTMRNLNQAFISTSPTLHIVVLFELALIIVLSVLYILIAKSTMYVPKKYKDIYQAENGLLYNS